MKTLLMLMLVAQVSVVWADCVSIDDDTARLKCYDEQNGRVPSSKALPKKTVPDEEVVAHVTAVSTRGGVDRLSRMELDNGQVWVETQRTGAALPTVGESVTIKRGVLGYLLHRSEGPALRVKRVK